MPEVVEQVVSSAVVGSVPVVYAASPEPPLRVPERKQALGSFVGSVVVGSALGVQGSAQGSRVVTLSLTLTLLVRVSRIIVSSVAVGSVLEVPERTQGSRVVLVPRLGWCTSGVL